MPFETDGDRSGSRMEIGYIVKENMIQSRMGLLYVEKLRDYLEHSTGLK